MTIDPLKIPCPFCGSFPVIGNGSSGLISCPNCLPLMMEEDWIEGGINALAGKLERLEGIKFFQKDYGFHRVWDWGYSWDDNHEDGILPRQFNSFDEAVFDAWETLKREKK